MQACGGRGPYPIKFNGSIFTVEPKRMGMPFNADWRAWGDCHWWQNVRFPYHPMLAGGDFEMMDPLFRMYESVRPLCEARAKIYHGVAGLLLPRDDDRLGHVFQRRLRLGPHRPPAEGRSLRLLVPTPGTKGPSWSR